MRSDWVEHPRAMCVTTTSGRGGGETRRRRSRRREHDPRRGITAAAAATASPGWAPSLLRSPLLPLPLSAASRRSPRCAARRRRAPGEHLWSASAVSRAQREGEPGVGEEASAEGRCPLAGRGLRALVPPSAWSPNSDRCRPVGCAVAEGRP
jgi:hypothetical protein